MITNIHLKNFKAIREASVELSNLNLLTGLNGMGKSSLIQSLLILRQSKTILDNALLLKGELVELGTGSDVLYQYAENEEIFIRIMFNQTHLLERTFIARDSQQLSANSIKQTPILNFGEESLFSKSFQYLTAEHLSPKQIYQTATWEDDSGDFKDFAKLGNLGKYGEYTAHYLSTFGDKLVRYDNLLHTRTSSKILYQQVDAWLSEISPNVRLSNTYLSNINGVVQTFKFSTKSGFTNEFKPVNVGFGLTYALPIIVSLLTASENDLLIIENPESHLHPKGQSKMGELMALAAQNGVQIIVETHSDHILNGFRVATKKRNIDAEKIRIYYFDRDVESDSHFCRILQPVIDQEGRIDEWPEGFFDEFEKNLMEL